MSNCIVAWGTLVARIGAVGVAIWAVCVARSAIRNNARNGRVANTIAVLSRLESDGARALREQVNAFVDAEFPLLATDPQWVQARELLNAFEDIAAFVLNDAIDERLARESLSAWLTLYWDGLGQRIPEHARPTYTNLPKLYAKWSKPS